MSGSDELTFAVVREVVSEEWARCLIPLIVAVNELAPNAWTPTRARFEFAMQSEDGLKRCEAALRDEIDSERRRARSARRRDCRHLAAVTAETEAPRPKFDPILGRELSEAEQDAFARRWRASRPQRVRRARARVLSHAPRRSCMYRPRVIRPRRTCGGRCHRPGARRTARATRAGPSGSSSDGPGKQGDEEPPAGRREARSPMAPGRLRQ
jgi:hypothetical protein